MKMYGATFRMVELLLICRQAFTGLWKGSP